jgi:hypothetical protein
MKIEDLKLDANDKKSMLERLKDLVRDNPTTSHPIDRELEKLNLVSIKNGLTSLVK